jgi:hypothetical protein
MLQYQFQFLPITTLLHEHAKALLVIVLEKQRKIFCHDHPHIRCTMNVLPNLYQSMGKLQAAQGLGRLIGGQAV